MLSLSNMDKPVNLWSVMLVAVVGVVLLAILSYATAWFAWNVMGFWPY